MHFWLAPARLAVAALAAVALGFSGYHAATGTTGVVNYFGYFTILSNAAAVVVLTLGGLGGLTGPAGLISRRPVPDPVRGAVVLYLVITGLVYGTVLAKYPDQLTIPWVNDVLHRVVPLAVLADWLIDPPTRRLRPRTALWWLGFPLLYLLYTLLRGWAAAWYPYPFLDPGVHGGYRRVAGACALVAAAFVVVGAAVLAAGNALAARRDGRRGTAPRGRRAHARTT
ncbi:Pr6Pr family membrane protein [Streptomyces sp. SP17BM10]|uniref:Pr6Pr family membrane protein n=1 Tax=Streptomyces sp. SP17BM10 TaxID=3002530 RepID=UPI002E7642D9|nr:Pr6Pr family membrane protein [Streptomyces sp. SP17BM10]MEE1787453.1 Pr6Pr family membrane protein [Streptomyces sp. SP17BM10]